MIRPSHEDFKYSVDVKTNRLVIVYCLRAISDLAQKSRNQRIAWGNTKNRDWEKANHCVTFRFTEPEFREKFKEEALSMFKEGLFTFGAEDDNNPAVKARPSIITKSYGK